MVKKGIILSLLGSFLVFSLLIIPIQPIEAAYSSVNGYTIDTSSLWYDHDSQTFGACVTDPNNNYFPVTYKLVIVSERPYAENIYESKNGGPWMQIGVINNEPSSQIGSSAKTGGRLFRVIGDMAAQSIGYNKMF